MYDDSAVLRSVHNLVTYSIGIFTKSTEGHQYRGTDGVVGRGLMPYKAHSAKCCFRFQFTRDMRFEADYLITCDATFILKTGASWLFAALEVYCVQCSML